VSGPVQDRAADAGPLLVAADAARLQAAVGAGGVAIFPADTVYGVCCDPDDARAVARLYALKGRPPARAAAVMFFTRERALAALPELADVERAAALALLPGAVTLLLPNPRRRWPAAAGEDPGTLGLRVPLLGARLAALADVTVAVMQSSANVSGGRDPRELSEVPERIRRGADAILDAGRLPGVSSTVVDLRALAEHGRWRVLREGAVGTEGIAKALAHLGR
jgi:L-threonylcarbamoyladenylate synthase